MHYFPVAHEKRRGDGDYTRVSLDYSSVAGKMIAWTGSTKGIIGKKEGLSLIVVPMLLLKENCLEGV